MAYLPKTLRAGNHDVPLIITKRPKSRRLTMRFHPIKREITVNTPARARQSDIAAFIARHERKMLEHIAQQPEPVFLRHDTQIPILGTPHIISPHEGQTDTLPHFVVMAPRSKAGTKTKKQLEQLFRTHINQQVEAIFQHKDFAALPRPTQISLRDTASRWGSCSTDGKLMFSWRLVFAPEYVANYVILHECCHLIHHDHSKAFWALCAKHCEDMEDAMCWLKNQGKSLFSYCA